MQTTDLTTKEDDLNIVYGPDYMGEKVNERALSSLKYMYTDLTDIRKYYMRLGFHLNEFNVDKSYLEFGYSTLEEFCDVNLGLDKSAVSRCINVYREFNAKNDVIRIGNYESCGSAMDLSERWNNYSYTQLCELLPLTEVQRRGITPNMTVKQIREYKKSLKEKSVRSLQPGNPGRYLVASTQPENLENDPVLSTQPEDSDGDPVASTQLFDFDEYEDKKGIVRYNYVKKCDPVEGGRYKYLTLVDSRGAEIIRGVPCDTLIDHSDCLVIRMCKPYNPAEPLELDLED